MRGYALPMLDTGLPVMSSIHPSYIRRGHSELVNVLAHDIKKAVAIASGKLTTFCLEPAKDAGRTVRYITKPTLDDARSYVLRARENQGAVLSFDLETDNSAGVEEDNDEDVQIEVDAGNISQAQFSLGTGEAIAFPWAGDYRSVARELLTLPHIKAAHNGWRFDLPVFARQHVKVEGVVHDTRWMWHHLQPDLPAHLQFVSSFYGMPFPWKHLADYNQEFYGCADADAVSRIMSQLPKQMGSKGVWASYERQIVGLEPILVSMTQRGIPVDNEERKQLGETILAEREKVKVEAQQWWPTELLKFHPPEGYKKPPADKTGLIQREFKELKQEGQFELVECPIIRWCKQQPFNLGSWQQVIEYMRFKKHPVPKKQRTGADTTEDTELQKLAKKTRDPMYPLILVYREMDKMHGTYVVGWTPDANGLVHPSFNYGTAVGQLASKNPNGQNFPRRRALSKKMRKMIRAKDGFKLIELDMSAFHAVTLAFEAQSVNWMRLARSDIHSFVTAHFLKLPERDNLLSLPDDELVEYLSWVKKTHGDVRDNKAKHAILGVGNGLGYRKMYRQYWEFFDGEKECKVLLDTIKGIFPEVFRYQNMRRQEAHRQTYLLSRWNYIRWFFDVMHYDWKAQDFVPGEDSEAAIAFHHVNDAFGLMRENMLWMRAGGLDERYGFCNTLHDSLFFHCPDDFVDECVWVMHDQMTKRCLQLVDPVTAPMGLWFNCEAKVGQDWASMVKIKVDAPCGLREGPIGEMKPAPVKWDVSYGGGVVTGTAPWSTRNIAKERPEDYKGLLEDIPF